jgi:hypothetical protein
VYSLTFARSASCWVTEGARIQCFSSNNEAASAGNSFAHPKSPSDISQINRPDESRVGVESVNQQDSPRVPTRPRHLRRHAGSPRRSPRLARAPEPRSPAAPRPAQRARGRAAPKPTRSPTGIRNVSISAPSSRAAAPRRDTSTSSMGRVPGTTAWGSSSAAIGRRATCRIGSTRSEPEAKACLCALEHCLGGADFGLANSA